MPKRLQRKRQAGYSLKALSTKSTADGWYEVTNDAALVPLIDSENYRTTKEKFTELIHAGMIAPDQTQPVRQKTA